jgi:ankyrin repeat protein
LIDKEGADLEAKDNSGRTTLHSAAEGGHLECIKYLIDKGADIEAKDYGGGTPLHSAAEGGHLECLKYLIGKGADLEAKDSAGKTPLHSAAYSMWRLEDLECLTFLIDQKAEVNARDNQNNTPLYILGQQVGYGPFYGVDQNYLRAAEVMIKAGADLTAVNNEGKTPMDNEFVQILREQKPELFLQKTA